MTEGAAEDFLISSKWSIAQVLDREGNNSLSKSVFVLYEELRVCVSGLKFTYLGLR